MAAQLRPLVLDLEPWFFAERANLHSRRDRDHDGSLLLVLCWILNRESFAAADDLKNAQHIDGKNTVEKYS